MGMAKPDQKKKHSQIFEMLEEYKRGVDKEKQHVQEVISKLEKKIQSLSTQSCEEEELLKKEMASLDSQVAALVKSVGQCEVECREVKEELERLKSEEKENSGFPKERHAVNLYRDISRIKFHAGNDASELKGFVCMKSAEIKTFCFDRQKQSTYFIANSLWEMGDHEHW